MGVGPLLKSFKIGSKTTSFPPPPPCLLSAMAKVNLLYLLPVAVLAAAVVYRRLRRWGRTRRFPLPPGPKGYPVIGNVLDIPRGVPLWEGILALGRKFGESTTPCSTNVISPTLLDTDVLYLNLFGKDMIILNTTKTISDLLDKRSKIYSDKVSFATSFHISADG